MRSLAPFVLVGVVVACGGAQTPNHDDVRAHAAAAFDAPPSPSVPPAAAPPKQDALLDACTRESHAWTTKPPPSDDETALGVGRGATIDDAMDRARGEAAKSIEVNVTSEIEDTQVDWERSGGAAGKRSEYETKVKAFTRSQTDRRMQGCRQVSVCRVSPSEVALLVSCSRKSELERQLAKAATAMTAGLSAKASVLLVPGTDDRGWITGFGEYVARVLRSPLSRALPSGATLLKLPDWTPAELRQVARKQGATHFARIEHVTAGAGRVRIDAWMQDAASDKAVSPVTSFEVPMEEGQTDLLAVRGPLLPQKAAMDLARDLGDRRLELRLSKSSLAEGEKVDLEFSVAEPSYVYVFDLYEDGNAALLVPSPFTPDNLFRPGKHRIPDEGWKKQGQALVACPIKGHAVTKETIKVIASPTPLDLPGTGGASHEALTFDGPAGRTADLLGKLNEIRRSGGRFSDASAPYVINAAPSGAKSPCR